MLSKSWQVGMVFGIPIYVNFTWFLILPPIAVSLALGYMPARYPWFNPLGAWAVSVSATCLLFLSVLGHELAHAIVARRNGMPVERISLFLFGGVAMMRREPATAWIEAKMAVAGPLCSLVLAIILAVLYVAIERVWPTSPPTALVEYLAIVNMALALFNLLPAFPLDGGRLLRALIWAVSKSFKRATWAASVFAQGLALLLIFWGLLRLITGFVDGGTTTTHWIANTWIVLTGWFIGEAARAGYGEETDEQADEVTTAGDDQQATKEQK